MRITLSRRAARALTRKRRLKARLGVSFKPATGASSRLSRRLTLRAPRR